MADRYWVGGTETWNDTKGTKWAATSGGAGGESYPTVNDNVYFDANSGSGTVTISSFSNCNNLDFTGYTGALSGSSFGSLMGNLTYSALMTQPAGANGKFNFKGSGIQTITSNGHIGRMGIDVNSSTSIVVLADDYNNSYTASGLSITSGTFKANNKNVTMGRFYTYGDEDATLYMGTGTWTITGSSGWNSIMNPGASFYIYPDSSTLVFTNAGTSTTNFQVNNTDTYHRVWANHNVASQFYVPYGFACNTLKISPGITAQFGSGETYIAKTFSLMGIPGSVITLQPNGALHFHLNKTSGVVVGDYLSLSKCYGEGGADWYAGENSSGSGTSGWVFTDYTQAAPCSFNQ